MSTVRHVRKKRQRLASGKTKLSPLDVKEVDPIDEVTQVALPPWYFSSWFSFLRAGMLIEGLFCGK